MPTHDRTPRRDAPLHAVIMAGGRGSRLAPYTTVLPKPLMPLNDRPILDVLLRQLVRAGVAHISISVGHLGGLIEAWVRHERDYGVPIEFVYEAEPLGTAGALRNIERPPSTFLALNGDILMTLSFADLLAFSRRLGASATLAVQRRDVGVEYGVVHFDEHGHLTRLDEKPNLHFHCSMGVYALEPAVCGMIADGEAIDFPDLFARIGADDGVVGVYQHDGYWRDIGNRDDYDAAISDFAADPARFIGADGDTADGAISAAARTSG
jgi:NDP-sugar pyrophosphorylase family protein